MKVRPYVPILLALIAFVFLGVAELHSAPQEQQPLVQPNKEGLPTFVVPDVAKKIKLVAYGDIRFTDPEDTQHTNVIARRALLEKIAVEKPNALLISGDIPYRGGNSSDWQVADTELKQLWNAKIRLYPALGNHEFMGGSENEALRNWWKRFPDLDGKRWYSVLFGNCYFIVLDSDSKIDDTDPQGRWLTGQLAHLPVEVDFVFVITHHPPYTDSHDHIMPGLGHSARKQEKQLAARLEQLQPRTRARIISIAGHVHNYERFEHASVTYIVSGGGGATPYVFDRSGDDKYQGGNGVNYNYVRLDIDGTRLKGTMVRLNLDSGRGKFEDKDSFEVNAAPLKVPAITGPKTSSATTNH